MIKPESASKLFRPVATLVFSAAISFWLAYGPAFALAPGIGDLERGVQFYGNNQCAKALVELNKAALVRPNDPFVLLARADTLLNLNRPKEALADLQKSLKVSRYKGNTYSRLGLCYMELHNPAMAEKVLEQSIKLNELDILRWSPWLDYLNLAAAKQGLRKFKEAQPLRALGNRMRLQQDARQRREEIDMPGAMETADQAVQVKPDNLYSHYMRGIIRLNAGHPAGALEDFNLIISKQSEEALPYYFRADAYCESEQFDKAIADYSKIIAMAPAVVAIVDVAESGRCKSIGKGYDETAVTLADIYYLRAAAYLKQGKLDKAKPDLQSCLKLAPDDLDAKIMTTELLFSEGKKAEALAALQKLVQENPKDVHSLQLSATTFAKMGMLDKAFEIADKLVRVSRNETDALLCRAGILQKMGKLQAASSDYTAALANDDFNEDALFGRAKVYSQLGDRQKCLKDCDNCVKYAESPQPEVKALRAMALQKLGARGGAK